MKSFCVTKVATTATLSLALSALWCGAAGAAIGGVSHLPTPANTNTGVIKHLKHVVMIGSTVDPTNGDQNPYGLTIAPVTSGSINAGDLLISNFNNGNPFNTQGLGTTVEVLHPVPGSTPTRLVQDPRLTGPSAIVTGTSDDFAWVSAFTANGVPILGDTPSSGVIAFLTGNGLAQPWGQTFSATKGIRGLSAFYVSNAMDGSITRINITKAGKFTYDTIVTGFSVNHGVPGTVLAPAGLTYDARADVLYIVDGNMDRVVAISAPGKLRRGAIMVTASGGFVGQSAGSARVVFGGPPLQAPISAALLFNGNLVVGNTSNNRLIEITPAGRAVGNVNLDTGPPGALFGIATAGTSVQSTQVFFNDDNSNTVEVLQM